MTQVNVRGDILFPKDAAVTHNLSNTRIYNTWCCMKQRCLNANHKSYKNYGGRDISICKEWVESFERFYKWSLQHGYSDSLQLERKDNDGNYEPENCEWVNAKRQARNRRSNVTYQYNGIKYCFKELCEVLDIGYSGAWKRLNKGLQADEIFKTGNIIRIDAGQCQG